METEQIRQFVTAAECKTFREAADRCHVSQSTLTRSVQRIEQALGAELFERRGRRSSLSKTGEEVLPHARRIVEEAELMCLKARELQRGAELLSIASCAPAPLWRLVPVLAAQLPGCSLNSRVGLRPEELEAGVASSEFDFAILPAPPSHGKLRGIRLMREVLSVSLPKEHELSARTSLSFSELDGETFIIQTGVGHWEKVVRRKLPHSSFVTAGDYILTANMMSISPLPHFATTCSMENVRASKGHVLIPLTDAEATADFWLVWRQDRAVSLTVPIESAKKLADEA